MRVKPQRKCRGKQAGVESVVSGLEHGRRVATHERDGGDVKTANHGVRFPATKKLNDVRVNVSAKQASGAAGAK